ncbi:hypothetical protein M405DRAFT_866921 [Rhizopogon salebrosus TDB-379]|nr:hypothetical protein M405DRAFT_866921 [Rhizopogon salebrosus TDB-379]
MFRSSSTALSTPSTTMRFILVSTVLLAQAISVLCQQHEFPHQDPLTCEERAKLQGLPTDGWKVVYEDGQPMCKRESVITFCDGNKYIDADTNHEECCPDANSLTWINQHERLAKARVLMSIPTDYADRAFGNSAARLENTYKMGICGSGKSLGIKYGHCYILSFGDGKQLSTVRENTLYSKGGFFHDIPFKVCKATDDCARGKTVEMGESFYLEDQQGRYNDPKGTTGWIDNASGGAHIGFTLDAKAAGTFTGIPTCAGGECAIKVLGGPTKSGSAAATCPSTMPGISFWGNPKMHDPLRFSEVTCDDYEVPPTSGISPNVHN